MGDQRQAVRHLSYAEWEEEGRKRFGANTDHWRFVCPMCGHTAAIGDFRPYANRGATANSATCECIGRYQTNSWSPFGGNGGPRRQPCDYAGYGLFRLSPLRVAFPSGAQTHCFDFAPAVEETSDG